MTLVQLYGLFFLVAGAVMGSFGNMLIYRLPEGLRLTGRSHCPQCNAVLTGRDLLPIVSYLWLRGRCRHCKAAIGWRYVAVEIASALLFVLAFWQMPTMWAAAVVALALWCLFIIMVIDAQTQGIPDMLSLPFVGLGFAYAIFFGQLSWYALAIGTGFFALQWLVSWGRWIGSGDVLLALGISALLGSVEKVLVMLFVSYIVGALAALYLLSRRRKTGADQLAFGPFMGIGTVVALFWGDAVIRFLLYM